ncbi:hypothetical protein JJB07_12155 [Tumebacillus sp. ITR2]|uniref:Uncharacterized protein n=1 Tax=Tumebacillus amylolyticus TaxID=2801339 RepID=A0ABS1JAV3_9BACL|nr:hypothetical protein [Tumebacillus amylolyticus]MBL0387406.1 hypothetical protein [Tumebacillus amylolyticus]
MALIFMEGVAILLFWRFIDKNRLREWFPLVLTGVFLRFLYQFFLIDWMGIWVIPGPPWAQLWAPISADLTIWPVLTLFYLQAMPQKKWRMWYSMAFVLGSVLYLKLLAALQIVTTKPPWNFGIGLCVQSFFYSILYGFWRWLSPEGARGGTKDDRRQNPELPKSPRD